MIGKVWERVGAGGDTINRLNHGREVGLVGSTSHLLPRPTPTNSLMSLGPVMEMRAAGHGHIYCWSCSSPGITRRQRKACLRSGNGRCVDAQAADTTSCSVQCTQESLFLPFLYLISRVLNSTCPHWWT